MVNISEVLSVGVGVTREIKLPVGSKLVHAIRLLIEWSEHLDSTKYFKISLSGSSSSAAVLTPDKRPFFYDSIVHNLSGAAGAILNSCRREYELHYTEIKLPEQVVYVQIYASNTAAMKFRITLTYKPIK